MKLSKKLLFAIKKHIGGDIIISKRGVPYLKVYYKNSYYSICYFGQTKIFRSWVNSGTENNEKYKDFNSVKSIIEHFV